MLNIPEEVKRLLKQDSVRKNFRVHFPNGEYDDITNENIEAENVSFTESLCSQESLKFGLCEASMLEFTTRDVGNIKGCEIEAYLEVDISSLPSETIESIDYTLLNDGTQVYQIPYGVFIVDDCKRQAGTTKRQVKAYTRETDWSVIPNPLEQAKFNGELNITTNTPFKCNIFAFAYANLFNKYNDFFFTDKKESKLTYESLTGGMFNIHSNEKTLSPNGEHATPKYNLSFQIISASEEISDNNPDFLYELTCKKIPIEAIRKVEKNVLDYLNNNIYDWVYDKEKFENKNEIVNQVKKEVEKINYSAYTYGSKSSFSTILDISGYNYIYPYVGYTDEEANKIIEEHGNLYDLYLPKALLIVVFERTIDNDGNIDYSIVSKEDITLREESELGLNIITMPQIYMPISRSKKVAKTSLGSITYYPLNKFRFDIKNFLESAVELSGMFGRTNRYGVFELVSINTNFGLYPSEELYPNEELQPNEPNGGIISRSFYKTAWYDDLYTKPYGTITVTYKNENEESVFASYDIVDKESENYDETKYQTYSLDNNYLVQNCTFTQEQMENILSIIAENIDNIQYMPADIDLKGMPWLEPGDVIVVLTETLGIETLILNRRITGIQSLSDNFESK